MNPNFQAFGISKTHYSSPNFITEENTFTTEQRIYNPSNHFLEREKSYSYNPKKNEEFIKDNLSNIEETANHSFNSGKLQEILKSHPPKSHFLDDFQLIRRPSDFNTNISEIQKQESCEIKSDFHANLHSQLKPNEDFARILDENSEYESKQNINFNDFTIKPELETHSVYYFIGNKAHKHGPYSVDMNQNQILDNDLRQEPFYEKYNEIGNDPIYFNTFNNTISEKKIEKKNSTHHKGLSGDFNHNYYDHSNKKNVNFLDLFLPMKMQESCETKNVENYENFKFQYQPVIKERTNFMDIFKNEHKSQSPSKEISENFTEEKKFTNERKNYLFRQKFFKILK